MTAPGSPRRVAIIGAGITGLAAAHRLMEIGTPPPAIQVFDAAPRPGGIMATREVEGFRVEEGPDAFITSKPEGVALARRLGLEGKLQPLQQRNRRSFVVHDGRLHVTPAGFRLLAPGRLSPLLASPVLGPLGKLRAAAERFLPSSRDDSDESIERFVRRRFGAQVYERLAQPMVTAVYGADPGRLSLLATLPAFRQMERESGSILRALAAAGRQETDASGARYGLFTTLEGGMQTLVDALVQRLPPAALRLSTPVKSLARANGGSGWRLRLAGGEVEADGVVLALPAPTAAPLLQGLDGETARKLSFIRYGWSATVALGFPRAAAEHPLDGFGFVAPSRAGLSILGCTFVHEKFRQRAPEGQILLRAFHGERSVSLSSDDLVEASLRDLRPLLGLKGPPIFSRVIIWERSLPQYAVGHRQQVAALDQRMAAFPGVALAGNAYGGVGVPDCIRSGENAAAAVLRHLEQGG